MGAWPGVQGRSPVRFIEDETASSLSWKFHQISLTGRFISMYLGPNYLQGRSHTVAEAWRNWGCPIPVVG